MPKQYTPSGDQIGPLLSVEEAAACVGRSRHTLDHYRTSGRGPAFVRTDKGRIAYLRADLEAWMAEANAETHNLIDTEAAAAIVGCSVKHLQNLRSYGAGPAFVKLKGQQGRTAVFYRPEDVTAWRDAR